MMVQFLKTDVVWADRFEDVWLWMDWPGRPPHGDHGIDLVARERETGNLVAIQCKFYDPASTIYKQHIDSFLAESGKHPFHGRVIVTTTDHWGPNAEEAIKDRQIPVTRLRFRDLAESSIDWLRAPGTLVSHRGSKISCAIDASAASAPSDPSPMSSRHRRRGVLPSWVVRATCADPERTAVPPRRRPFGSTA
jgi:hypothetical protein